VNNNDQTSSDVVRELTSSFPGRKWYPAVESRELDPFLLDAVVKAGSSGPAQIVVTANQAHDGGYIAYLRIWGNDLLPSWGATPTDAVLELLQFIERAQDELKKLRKSLKAGRK
jgi:hypothetical protein